MLNTIRKTFFTDREVIDLMRQTPLVQDALQARIHSAALEEKAERERILDALEENGRRQRQIDKDIEKQQPVHDAAHAAWKREADKLGELFDLRLQLTRAETELCGDLANNGEGPLDDAIRMLWEGVVSYSVQINELESDLRTYRRDQFDGTYPEKRGRMVAELDYLKRRLQWNRSAITTMTPWRMARIPPREQIARVEKLMASRPA